MKYPEAHGFGVVFIGAVLFEQVFCREDDAEAWVREILEKKGQEFPHPDYEIVPVRVTVLRRKAVPSVESGGGIGDEP